MADPRIPARGYYVEIQHPDSGNWLSPTLADEPEPLPVLNDYPRWRIPVTSDDKWDDDFDGASLRLWYNGERQAVEEVAKVKQQPGQTMIEAVGATALRDRIQRDVVQREAHLEAESIIQNETPYTPNVDSPTATRDENVLLQSASTDTDFSNITSFADDVPLTVGADGPEMLQSSFTFDTPDFNSSDNYPGCSSGTAKPFGMNDFDDDFTFNLDYTIPADDWDLFFRMSPYELEHDDFSAAWVSAGLTIYVDGDYQMGYADGFSSGYGIGESVAVDIGSAILEDSGSTTDYTSEMQSSSTSDVPLLPSSYAYAGDAFYFGYEAHFDEVEIDITTAGSGNWSITWEYYAWEYDNDTDQNIIDSGWRPIPGYPSDGTNGLRSAGKFSFGLDYIHDDTQAGGDYVHIGESPTTGSDRAIRARVSSGGSVDTQPMARQGWPHWGAMDFRTQPGDFDLTPGDHTIRVQYEDSAYTGVWDLVGVRDNRYTYTDPVGNPDTGKNGYFYGPEPMPDAQSFAFDTVSPTRAVAGGRITATMDDYGGAQALRLSNDQQTTWETSSNTSQFTYDWGERSPTITGGVTLSRYGETSGQTPLRGVNSQTVTDYELEADLVAIPILDTKGYDDTTMNVLQEIADYGDFVFEFTRTDSGYQVEWTQPGQRTNDSPVLNDLIDYTVDRDFDQRVEEATVLGSSREVVEESFSATLDSWNALDNGHLVENSETVYDPSTDPATTYVRGQDYEIKYISGEVNPVSDGAITSGQTVAIDYSYNITGEFTASGVSDPASRPFSFPNVPTERGAGQVALQIVQTLKSPLVTGELLVPSLPPEINLVEAIQPPEKLQQYTDGPVEIKKAEMRDQQLNMIMRNRRTTEETIQDIRNRLSTVSLRS